jgi:hypothetical protein
LPLQGGFSSIAFDVHLEDRGVMNKPVDGGERHGGIGKDAVPFSKRLIGGDQHGSPFIAGADEFEEDGRFGLILGDVGEIVEDQEMVLFELGDRGLEREFPSGDLKLLDEIGGSGEENPPSVLDQSQADGRREMRLATSGRTGVILPGVRRLKSGSRIGFTRARVISLRWSASGGMQAPITSLSGSPITPWRCCRRG